jgi:hypothetical protein
MIVLAVAGVRFEVMCMLSLYGQTAMSINFSKASAYILNNVTVVPVLLRLFHERQFFESWLNGHAIAAGRVFDVRITISLLAKIGLMMGTILALIVGLFIRKEFSWDRFEMKGG